MGTTLLRGFLIIKIRIKKKPKGNIFIKTQFNHSLKGDNYSIEGANPIDYDSEQQRERDQDQMTKPPKSTEAQKPAGFSNCTDLLDTNNSF